MKKNARVHGFKSNKNKGTENIEDHYKNSPQTHQLLWTYPKSQMAKNILLSKACKLFLSNYGWHAKEDTNQAWKNLNGVWKKRLRYWQLKVPWKIKCNLLGISILVVIETCMTNCLLGPSINKHTLHLLQRKRLHIIIMLE